LVIEIAFALAVSFSITKLQNCSITQFSC